PRGREQGRHGQLRLPLGARAGEAQGRAERTRQCRGALAGRTLLIADPLFYALAIPAVALLGLSKGGFAGAGALSLPMIAFATDPVQAAAILLPLLI
ncbi:hypothetical protein ABTD14_19630, partial [Acinetobacter baumannii]